MKNKNGAEFIIKIPRKLYSKDLQKMFDYVRYKKAVLTSKATQKEIDDLVESVRKTRNEKRLAQLHL